MTSSSHVWVGIARRLAVDDPGIVSRARGLKLATGRVATLSYIMFTPTCGACKRPPYGDFFGPATTVFVEIPSKSRPGTGLPSTESMQLFAQPTNSILLEHHVFSMSLMFYRKTVRFCRMSVREIFRLLLPLSMDAVMTLFTTINGRYMGPFLPCLSRTICTIILGKTLRPDFLFLFFYHVSIILRMPGALPDISVLLAQLRQNLRTAPGLGLQFPEDLDLSTIPPPPLPSYLLFFPSSAGTTATAATEETAPRGTKRKFED